jgi:hypothetical protein
MNKYYLSKLTQEETEKLNRLLVKRGTESVVEDLQGGRGGEDYQVQISRHQMALG